jgi:hypothetical protein
VAPSGQHRVQSPLIGVNYTHVGFPDCDLSNTGILAFGQDNGMRARVVDQLSTMRGRGVAAVRLIVWHMSDPNTNDWGVISSADGRLTETNRTNLINYVRMVRDIGFSRLTVAFGPQWTNSPLRDNYDPSKWQENWLFIRQVRAIVERFGPSQIRFDLLNEGAPSRYLPPAVYSRVSAYIARLYPAYVSRYGHSDVTISTIAPATFPDQGDRLGNLIAILRATGKPLPERFEIHLNYAAPGVAHGLAETDSTLRQAGLTQPLVIGEAPYNARQAAQAVDDFLSGSARSIEEVTEWYKRPSEKCNETPPYEVNGYEEELNQHADA